MASIRRPRLTGPFVDPSKPRLDVEFDWDGRGFLLEPPGSQEASAGSETAIKKAMKDGKFLPVWVGTKSVGTVRIVLGDLLPQEEAEWIGQLTGRLRLDEGILALMDQEIQVPAGDYRVDVFCYLPAVLLFDFLITARVLGDEPQPLGDWFRRTRPGKEMPLWLQAGLASGWISDTKEESAWGDLSAAKKRALTKSYENKRYVEVLLRLTPRSGTVPVSPVERSPGGTMYVAHWEARKPELCPFGLECSPTSFDS